MGELGEAGFEGCEALGGDVVTCEAGEEGVGAAETVTG